MKKPEPYIIIFALCSLLIIVNLLASIRIYQRISKPVAVAVGASRHSESVSPDGVVNDMKTLLAQNELRRNSYQLIAEKNLFSAQRTAWQPPVVEDPETEVVVSQARRTDVVLYGTFVVGDKMGALLEFTSLKSDQRKKTLFPGDKVSSASGSRNRSYVLLKVEPSSVMIKDNKGIVFNVDLYNAKKRQSKVTTSKTSISITKDESVKESSSAAIVGSKHSTEAEKVVKARQSAVARQKKVESGELRKVATPFGTTYIKKSK